MGSRSVIQPLVQIRDSRDNQFWTLDGLRAIIAHMMTHSRFHRRTLLSGSAALVAGLFVVASQRKLLAQVATPLPGDPIVLHANRVPRQSNPDRRAVTETCRDND